MLTQHSSCVCSRETALGSQAALGGVWNEATAHLIPRTPVQADAHEEKPQDELLGAQWPCLKSFLLDVIRHHTAASRCLTNPAAHPRQWGMETPLISDCLEMSHLRFFPKSWPCCMAWWPHPYPPFSRGFSPALPHCKLGKGMLSEQRGSFQNKQPHPKINTSWRLSSSRDSRILFNIRAFSLCVWGKLFLSGTLSNFRGRLNAGTSQLPLILL